MISLGMGAAYESRHYFVMLCFISWTHILKIVTALPFVIQIWTYENISYVRDTINCFSHKGLVTYIIRDAIGRKLTVWIIARTPYYTQSHVHSVCCEVGDFFMQSLKCYFGVNFQACEAMGEICTKITLKRVHKQFHGSIYIILMRVMNP